MDIDYLLFLQNARESLPHVLELFLLAISYVADGPGLIALAFIVYWCIDKRAGQFACACFAAGNFINQLLKNIFCIYRPWVRDSRVMPVEAALDGAGSYSFPSAHATGAGTVLGSFAWSFRKHYKPVSIVCIVLIVLVAFSRNYLGVHTPQDVLVGLCIAALTIGLSQMFFNWIERYDALLCGHNKDLLVLIVICVLCIASLVFVSLKAYPLDYVDGELLVNPEDMMKGSFEAAGVFIGMTFGWFMERRYICFSTDNLCLRERAARGVVGVIIVGIVYVVTRVIFKLILPTLWAKFAAMLILSFVAIYAIPLLFSKISSRVED